MSCKKLEFIAVILALISATLWSQQHLAQLSFKDNSVIIQPWIDTTRYSGIIADFAFSGSLESLSSPDFAGIAPTLYHYLSYMFPALLVRLAGIDSFSAGTSVLVPFGFFLLSLFAYVIAYTLSKNQWAGITALVFATLIPDASYQGFGNGWTSYLFFMQNAAGSSYAVVALGMMWMLFIRARQNRSWRAFISAFIMGVFAVFSKVTLTYVFAPLSAVVGAFMFPKLCIKKKLIISGLIIAVNIAVICLVKRVQAPPAISFNGESASIVVDMIMRMFHNTSYVFTEHYLSWLTNTHKNFLGVHVIFLTIFGYLGISLVLLIPFVIKQKLSPYLILFPLFILTIFLLYSLGLEVNCTRGDSFEFNHKTFLFPYFIIAVCDAVILVLLLKGYCKKHFRISSFVISSVLVLFLFFAYNNGKNLLDRTLSQPLTHMSFPRGLYDCARFIRASSSSEEVVQLSENDKLTLLTAFSERNSYFVISKIPFGAGHKDEIRKRKSYTEELALIEDTDSIQEKMQKLGINWYVVTPEDAVRISDLQAKAEFESQGFFVIYSPGLD